MRFLSPSLPQKRALICSLKNGKENNLLQLFLILLFIISNRSSFAQIGKGLKKNPSTEISHGTYVGAAHLSILKVVFFSNKEEVTRLCSQWLLSQHSHCGISSGPRLKQTAEESASEFECMCCKIFPKDKPDKLILAPLLSFLPTDLFWDGCFCC